jgi:hypothetical protein
VPYTAIVRLTGDGELRDTDMLARAHRLVDAGGAQPQLLFLFFVGTHFRYSYPAGSARFAPCWDGAGTYRTAHLYPALVRERARNAAYEVDWKLDESSTTTRPSVGASRS